MPKIVILDGPQAGQEFPLEGDAVIGRLQSTEVFLPQESVSRNHAKITKTRNGYKIEDLGSTNGTFVNGTIVTEKLLADGDKIKIGNFLLEFVETAQHVPSRGRAAQRTIVEFSAPSTPDTATGTGSILANLDASDHQLLSAIPRGRRAEALVEFNRRLTIMYNINQIIASSLDIDVILEKILDELFRAFPNCERGFIMLKAPDSDELTARVTRVRGHVTDRERITVSSTIIAEVMSKQQSILSTDALSDARFRAGVSVADMHIRSFMCSPLVTQEEILGILYLDTTSLADQFSKDDLALLTGIGTQAALLIANARMHERLLTQQRIENDLAVANEVQISFLPPSAPSRPGYSFSAHYTAAYAVGGDFYDFIELGRDRVAVTVGDVSGKGIAAALLMAKVTSDLRFRSTVAEGPGEILNGVNQAFCARRLEARFITLVYTLINVKEHSVILANAGHIPAIVRRDCGELLEVGEEEAGLPIGVEESVVYEQTTYHLEPGDCVVLCTDGIIEAMNTAGNFYGMDRLAEAVKRAPQDADKLVDFVLNDVHRFVGGATQSDDLTLVAFRRDKSGAGMT